MGCDNFIPGTFILVVIAKSSALNLSALQSSGANGAVSTLMGSYGIGAALVLGIFSGQHAMALASYPGLSVNLMAQVVDQMTATFLLVLGIAAVVDQDLNPGALLVGLIVVGVSLALGPNAGAAMNPAVDFMPR